MPEKPDVKPPVEFIPSGLDQISAIASAHAPFLYFDRVPTYGANHSMLNITLEADRNMVDAAGAPARDKVVVAHLRMSVPAAIPEGRNRGRAPYGPANRADKSLTACFRAAGAECPSLDLSPSSAQRPDAGHSPQSSLG